MKKLLAVFGVAGLTLTASAGVVSCDSTSNNLSDMNFSGYDINDAINQDLNESWFAVSSAVDSLKLVPRSIHFFLDGKTTFADKELEGLIYYAATYTAIARSMGMDLVEADATGDIGIANQIATSELEINQVDGETKLDNVIVKPDTSYSIILKAKKDAKKIEANSVSKAFNIKFEGNKQVQFDLSKMNFNSGDSKKLIDKYLVDNKGEFIGKTFGDAKASLLEAAFKSIMLEGYWNAKVDCAFANVFKINEQLLFNGVYNNGKLISNWSSQKIEANKTYSVMIDTPHTGSGDDLQYTALDVKGDSGLFNISF